MNVIINSVHFKADKKLETFVKEKMEKLPTIFDGVIGAEVKLKIDNNDAPENKIAEIRLMISKTIADATPRMRSGTRLCVCASTGAR